MTLQEFNSCFEPLVTIYFPQLSMERIKPMAMVYFDSLKSFPEYIWRRATRDFIADDEKKFPKPAEWVQKCRVYITPIQPEYKPLISREEAQKPSNVAARRHFYEALHNAFTLWPHSDTAFGLYEGLVYDPYQKEKRFQEQEKKREETIQKAEVEMEQVEQEELPF